MRTMKAAVFVEPGRIIIDEKPVPEVGPGDALVRITTTTICGTDVHILKGEYPVERGRIIGHEPVGVLEELGPGVTGYQIGQRVIVGAITPCGQCLACLDGHQAQCGGSTPQGDAQALGGWRFGNTIDGCQAEYVRVPYAMANLTPVPDGLSDEQVLMCPDIMSTSFGGAESGQIKIGDMVAVFAQGPIGLYATLGDLPLVNGRDVITGPELDRLAEDKLRRLAPEVHVFARASPENKLRLVEALKAEDAGVAMTDHGFNDAPALKRADVGVAMGQKGTEVANEAAEMVPADDNFASIAHAVEEGRTVYAAT